MDGHFQGLSKAVKIITTNNSNKKHTKLFRYKLKSKTRTRECKINYLTSPTMFKERKGKKYILLLLQTILVMFIYPNNFNFIEEQNNNYVQAISIKPADFDRFIMPCYLGGSSSYASSSGGPTSYGMAGGNNPAGQPQSMGIQPQSRLNIAGGSSAAGYQAPTYYGSSNAGGGAYQSGSSAGAGLGDSSGLRSSIADSYQREGGFSHLGQQVPRANTVDNFIALVSKIEAANPRLANNPDQLIRILLGRFRMDNFYYDVRNRMSISDQDHRITDIIPAILNYTFQQQTINNNQMPPNQYLSSFEDFPENLLDPDEKCSMYFMLSHFIVKETPLNPPLASMPVPQLVGPLGGQRPPSLQAAGSGYPVSSANNAYNGASGGGSYGQSMSHGNNNNNMNNNNNNRDSLSRYPGPAPSFGSPATNNMNSFGNGVTSQSDYSGNNPYGVNVPQPNINQLNNRNYGALGGSSQSQSLAAATSGGSFSGSRQSNRVPYVLAPGNSNRDDRQATEYGVVTIPGQENAAIVLNRVLMGLLASNMLSQRIRNLVPVIYPNQYISQTAKLDDEIDPLFAVTLADLWAISAIPKAGKPFDFKFLGDNGHWNDTMCPTQFVLERANSIKFTTAELLGGLDGLNLGSIRQLLLSRGRNLRLSDLLRMYYSKTGFRPQFAEYGICFRSTAINNRIEELRRQAENYLRLYELNLPTSDNDLAMSIMRLDSFKDFTRTAAQQYIPNDLCNSDSSGLNDAYPMDSIAGSEQCEIGKADIISILDTSPQSNELFMNVVMNKLAQKIGLSRWSNSFTILTNQQDTTGYGGSYSFNTIVKNSTNTAEIGCSLAYDTTRTYQGGQISDPTRLVEMFERALVNIDTEYLVRQNMGQLQSSSSSWTSSYSTNSKYVSSLFNYASNDNSNYMMGGLRPKNTGGAKIIIWFNYGQQTRPASLASAPTNWNNPSPYGGAQSQSYPQMGSSSIDQNMQYKFYEAKRYLKENFRGAAILAIATNRDDVKAFVDDEQKDIFTDIPAGSSGMSNGLGNDYYGGQSQAGYSMENPNSISQLNGPADVLVNRLLQRMCDIPAIFQYPMCFRSPSENVVSIGYISPRRKQNWMMSPKTFFSSKTVRMVFKTEGGRLRVCFGRMPKPDETATKNPLYQQYGYQQSIGLSSTSGGQSIIGGASQYGQSGAGAGSIIPGGSSSSGSSSSLNTYVSSGNNYYTGLDYGVCKDLSPGQEIDFVVDDPCYKKPIADCEPFYFVIKEITNFGEGDQNYMCKDPGCKRFDQVKFIMSHTGVYCSNAFKSIKANWVLILISILTTVVFATNQDSTINMDNIAKGKLQISTSTKERKLSKILQQQSTKLTTSNLMAILSISFFLIIKQAQAQLSAPFDFGEGKHGEKRGSFSPAEVFAIILLAMTIIVGLALTIGLCYYVTKKNSRGMQRVSQNDIN